MRAVLVVFLGVLALAAASKSRSQDAEMSELKKLLLRALERKVEEVNKDDYKTAADQDNFGSFYPNIPATQKEEEVGSPAQSQPTPAPMEEEKAKPTHPQPAPTTTTTQAPKVEEELGSFEDSTEEIELPEEPKPDHSKSEEKPAEDNKSEWKPEEDKKPEWKPAEDKKPEWKPTEDKPHLKPANASHKPANATRNSTNATHKPTTPKPADVVPQKPAVLLPPAMGHGPAATDNKPHPVQDTTPYLEHPAGVVIMPEDKDEFLPAPPKHDMLSLPISVMAFMMSSDVMKAAPLGTAELATGIQHFDVILRHVIKTLRRVAADVRKAPSLAASADQIEGDLEHLGRVFIPAQSGASAAFFRVMVYGLEERTVCDLESEDVTDCVAGRMQALARLFADPEHMDADINKMERCDHLATGNGVAKHALADDMECIADGVSKVLDYLRKMKDTVSEIQLAGLLDGRPLPKYHMDLDDVEHEVADELEEQFKAIMSLVYRLMMDASNMGHSLEY